MSMDELFGSDEPDPYRLTKDGAEWRRLALQYAEEARALRTAGPDHRAAYSGCTGTGDFEPVRFADDGHRVAHDRTQWGG